MKAAQVVGTREIKIVDIPDPPPGPGEVLLDVTAVSICGSDLHTYLYWEIGDIRPGGPIILGHEAAGVVRALGTGVDTLHVGQRVAIDPAVPCRACERCEAGDPNLCTRLKFIGLWPYQGAMCQQMVHPARSCVPVPDSITDIGAALLEPLGVALHAIRLAKIQVGDDVLITGCGAIGLMTIRLARLAGARHIYASDRYPSRQAYALTYGADMALDADHADVPGEVLRATGGRGVDVAIESAWAAETTSQCAEAARNGGRMVIVGIPVADVLSLRSSPTRRKGLTIKLSRRMKHTYPRSIALATGGQIDLDGMVTHRFPLAQAGKAMDTAATYADGVVRAVVLPNAE